MHCTVSNYYTRLPCMPLTYHTIYPCSLTTTFMYSSLPPFWTHSLSQAGPCLIVGNSPFPPYFTTTLSETHTDLVGLLCCSLEAGNAPNPGSPSPYSPALLAQPVGYFSYSHCSSAVPFFTVALLTTFICWCVVACNTVILLSIVPYYCCLYIHFSSQNFCFVL